MPRSRNVDRSQIKRMNDEGRLEIGEAVMLKLVDSANAGNPARGVGRTYTFKFVPTRAIIEQVDQNDVLNSGGIYQTGDIKIQLNEKLREVIDKVGNIGDRVVWQKSEYRVVGKRHPNTLTGDTFLYSYVVRKVDEQS